MKYYYCYNSRSNLFDTEIEYAKELNIYIYYDEEKEEFLDKDNNKINIKNMLIFPRSSIHESKKLVNAIVGHGGNSLVNKDDYDKTLNWPYYIKTKRNSIILSGSEIIANPQLIKSIFGNNKVFFKTKHKNYSGIIEISKITCQNSAFFSALKEHANDDFIVSDAVTIDIDKSGPLEYRAFVINDEIFNISRISDNLLSFVPKKIINKIEEIIDSIKSTDFPKSFVIDLFIYTDTLGNKVVDVLECNPIIASGTYLYNSIFEKIDDLEHKCPSSSIPKEKLKYSKCNRSSYSFNTPNNTNPSIFYNLPGGFAADLTSFTLFGTKSSKDTYFHFNRQNGQINILELQSLQNVISSDEDLLEIKTDTKSLSRIKTEYCSRR